MSQNKILMFQPQPRPATGHDDYVLNFQ